jgi:hypothetical protein
MMRHCNLSDHACCASGADAISAPAADAVKGLVPGVLQSFALPFQTRQRAQPTGAALVESQWDQPLMPLAGAHGADAICARGAKVVKGLVHGMLENFELPFRHRQRAAQPLRPRAGAQIEPQWD